MKKIRTEIETTPIGQEYEVEWFEGTPEEAETTLRETYGSIVILEGDWEWTATLYGTDTISLFGTDDPKEKIAVPVGEEDAYEKKHVRNIVVKHLSEVFSDEIDFTPIRDV